MSRTLRALLPAAQVHEPGRPEHGGQSPDTIGSHRLATGLLQRAGARPRLVASATPMRILYVAIDQPVPGPRGGPVHVVAVAEGLAALGHEVHVLAAPGDGAFPPGRVHWHGVAPPFGARQLRLARARRVSKIARDLRADVVIERYYNFGGEGIRAARAAGALAVLEINAPVVDYPGSAKRLIDRALLIEPMRRWREWQCRAADLLVTPSAAIVPAWVPTERILETEWGADTERFRPGTTGPVPFGRHSNEMVVVFAGAFRRWHGAITLVNAIAALRARGQRQVAAVFIGDGPELEPTRAAAAGHDGITFTGALPHDRMPACLAAADVGVAPFDVRAHAPLALGFYWSPLKIFEYMASGLPVVAPAVERLRRIVGDGREGLLYDPVDPGALPAALERLLDRDRRARLGAAARDRAVREFSWAAHCRKLDEAIRRARPGAEN